MALDHRSQLTVLLQTLYGRSPDDDTRPIGVVIVTYVHLISRHHHDNVLVSITIVPRNPSDPT